MPITRPSGDQLLFQSLFTGEHVLDTYLEDAEVGGRKLGTLLKDVFDGVTGNIKAGLVQFRLNVTSRELESRSGTYGDPEAGWAGSGAFFSRYRGDWATAQAYKSSDYVRISGVMYLVTTDHTSGASPDFSKFVDVLNSPNLSAIGAASGSAADTIPYFTAAAAAAFTPLTPYARTLLDDTTAAAARTTLGLTAAATMSFAAVPSLTMASGATLTLAAAPVTALEAATMGYVDAQIATRQANLGYTPVNKAGDSMSSFLMLHADPSSALHAATRQYVDAADSLRALLSGATFSGLVSFNSNVNIGDGSSDTLNVKADATLELSTSIPRLHFLRTSTGTWHVGGPLAAGNGFEIRFNAFDATLAMPDNVTLAMGVTNTIALGTSALRWSQLNSVLGNFSGLLTAQANVLVSVPGTGTAELRIQRTGGTTSDWEIYSPAGSSDLRLYSAADRLTLKSNGESFFSGPLGIGLSSAPAAPFHVASSVNNIGIINSTGANGGYLLWQRSGTTQAHLGAAVNIISGGAIDAFAIGVTGSQQFIIGNGTGGTARAFTLDGTGFASIGARIPVSGIALRIQDQAFDDAGIEFLRSTSTSWMTQYYNRAGGAYVTSIDNALAFTWQTSGTERFGVKSDGRVYGRSLHNVGTVTGTTDQFIASGTYSPGLTAVSNVSNSSGGAGQWVRVGNVVTVSGRFTIDPTATTTLTQLDIDLPIASTFTLAHHCAGTAISGNVGNAAAVSPAEIIAGSTKARLIYVCGTDSSSVNYSFTFTYQIL